ncbi:MAG: CotH kinase family protein [Bacteroidaceae bacterium]|nr:CotH kinase family protein [Bacteroidaceae bacterium]
MNKITTTITALMLSVCVHAADMVWVDVTDKYIMNPRYDNNDYTSYWNGTQLGAYNPHDNAEHYERNYDTYQVLSGLKPGKYRVSLSAFYRMGQANEDYNAYNSGNYSDRQHAKLYATSSINDYEVSIAPSSSAALSQSLGGDASAVGGWWGKYIPNNMEAAYLWFEAGYYTNRLECEVGNDGELRIGIRKSTTLNGDWTCIDNWKLEVYTELKKIESITFEKPQIDMVIGEKLVLTPIITPADATIQKLTWKSSNTNVLTVDNNGELTAITKGTVNVSAVATDGTLLYGTVKVVVADNAPSSENIIINEVMAQNIDVYLDPNQNYGSWVELYNPTDRSVNLEGLYVSDDRENLKKNKLVKGYGTLPAHGYAILNFDHHEVWTKMAYRQIDDKLDPDGGTIIVSDGTTIFAEFDYPASIGRTSYARTTDGGDTWGYSGNPTPNASNVDGMFANEQLDAPTVDKDAQLFNGSMQICVNYPEGATLKYTTNGSAPTLTNGEVSETGIFNIDKTTTFRFRVFKDGYLPSMVVTRSYIYDDGNNPFPIISVVTDPDNIYSNSRGAFKQGSYGRPGNGNDANCNWNMDWDHPVSFEFITTDNECVVSQECSFSMCGGWSRSWEPHSFKLKANKIYDFQNAFNYDFFPDEKPGLKQKTLQIRNGGNDNNCRIIDGAIQGIITQDSKFYVDYQAWQPVRVFINGSSYAVLNMREPNNKHHAYANYGIDTDEMDQFEMSPDSGYVQMEGTSDSFNEWYELSKTATEEESYEEIKQLVDLDEYINYMAAELYAGGTDWPQNNVKGFRDRNNGKFHFVLFDLDFALNTDNPFQTFFDKKYYTFDWLKGYDYSRNMSIKDNRKSGEIQFVTIFENMLKNADFRKRFIDAFCIVNGSLFTPERVQEIVNDRASRLAAGGYVNPWSSANRLINSYTESRQTTMINLLRGRSEFNLKSTQQFTADLSSDIKEAEILINDQPLPTGKLYGSLFTPVTLKATAPAGYKFKGWRIKDSNKTPKTIFTLGSAWKYYDKGSLDTQSWKASNYNDSGWQTGATPIGYGKNQKTTIQTSRPTYYFRKEFTLDEEPKTTDDFEMDYSIDDGWIVYVNGEEAGRYNMPTGNVIYSQYSTTYANGNPDEGTFKIKTSLFKKGKNVIAVEVHNNSGTSSDILWDAELTKYSVSATGVAYAYTEPEIQINSPKNISYIAEWEEMTEEEMIAEGINNTPVVINEVSASNSIYVNDYFKKNDWMELHNTTSDDIDIAGLYISDNLGKPTKYKVPDDDVALNTIIPAHSYKVIWCDKLENISDAIHTSFKLSGEEGEVIILSRDAEGEVEYSDTLKYTAHLGQQSFGRYPDAGSHTYVMDKPTPGKSNIYTTYAVEYVEPEPIEPEPDAIAIVRDGGMTIAYVNGVVNVKSEDYPILSVEVFSTSGAKVAGNITRNNGSFVTLNVSTLRPGIYVATAANNNGDECKIKFVVK